jgi:hypothetical protein
LSRGPEKFATEANFGGGKKIVLDFLRFHTGKLGSCMDGACGAREKNLTFSRNDTGAVMYPASKVQPLWLRALM